MCTPAIGRPVFQLCVVNPWAGNSLWQLRWRSQGVARNLRRAPDSRLGLGLRRYSAYSYTDLPPGETLKLALDVGAGG